MGDNISKRLRDIVHALPLENGMKVLEIGCGPSAMAREMARLVGGGQVLAIDRSAKAIRQAVAGSGREIAAGKLSFRQVAVEVFELEDGEAAFDIAVAVRVGALDGRHPDLERRALGNIARSLTKNGRLFIDGGDPLKEIDLDRYR